MNNSINNEILKTKINEDGIFRLTLSNQHNHNALSEEMMSNIQVALDESINNKKIRVVIISADGPTFSAGHDLKGYPLGLQIIGKPFDEQNILNIAYTMEEQIDFKNKIKDWWI